jgi:protein kinase
MFSSGIVKLIDFGTAKEQSAVGKLTDYVGTRWYRAPELLLSSSNYDYSVDIFALGCLMVELFLGRPIFPGTSESDQLSKVVSVLGTPSQSDWPDGHHLSELKGVRFPQMAATPLNTLIKRSVS